jgi:hypothetical protein
VAELNCGWIRLENKGRPESIPRICPKKFMRKLIRVLVAGLVVGLVSPLAHAAIIWNGPTMTFTKANGVNPLLAANQDRLTANDWLTRGSSQGLFNAKTESSFTHFASPTDTEWADGTIANYSSLTYHDWNRWAKGVHGGPTTTVGVNAVLHLKTDDIYLNIKFTSWTGGGAGGGFAYVRSTAPVPEPSSALLGLGGLLAAAGVRLARRRGRA